MTEAESKPHKTLEQIEQETGVNYDHEENVVTYTESKTDTQHFIDFVTYLFTESYIGVGDLPYTPGYGKIRYLLNTDPNHQDGRDMKRPEEIADSAYLETNHDSESKKRYTKQLIKDFILLC